MHWLKEVWVSVLGAFAIGCLFILWAGNDGTRLLVSHIGMALIIASIITAFYQLHEVSMLFKNMARSTLISNDYLALLDIDAIRKLRASAASEILRRGVNNPKYARSELETTMDHLLYSSLTPSATDNRGAYRADYSETVHIEFVSADEAKRVLQCSDIELDEAQFVVRETSIATYRVIAPRLDDPHFQRLTVPVRGTNPNVPGIPLGKRARCWVGTEESNARKVDLKFAEPAGAGYEFSGDGEAVFEEGSAKVWLKLEEWKVGFRQPQVLSLMTMPTRGVHINVQVVNAPFAVGFQGGVIGLGGGPNPTYGPNSVSLHHSGWLLEDQGYYVWWWRKSLREVKENMVEASSHIVGVSHGPDGSRAEPAHGGAPTHPAPEVKAGDLPPKPEPSRAGDANDSGH